MFFGVTPLNNLSYAKDNPILKLKVTELFGASLVTPPLPPFLPSALNINIFKDYFALKLFLLSLRCAKERLSVWLLGVYLKLPLCVLLGKIIY